MPVMCNPKKMTIKPPIFANHGRISSSKDPIADAVNPINTKTKLNPRTNASP